MMHRGILDRSKLAGETILLFFPHKKFALKWSQMFPVSLQTPVSVWNTDCGEIMVYKNTSVKQDVEEAALVDKLGSAALQLCIEFL